MSWPKVQTVVASVLALANTVVVFLISLSIVSWTDVQKGLVLAAVNTGAGLGLAVYAHLNPNTAPEPVAISVALTAFVTAGLGLAVGFGWWVITSAQVGAAQALIVGVVAFGSGLFARSQVTPYIGIPKVLPPVTFPTQAPTPVPPPEVPPVPPLTP